MRPDPILYAGGMNLYGYVGNDPVNFTDPLGLDHQACSSIDGGPPFCYPRTHDFGLGSFNFGGFGGSFSFAGDRSNDGAESSEGEQCDQRVVDVGNNFRDLGYISARTAAATAATGVVAAGMGASMAASTRGASLAPAAVLFGLSGYVAIGAAGFDVAGGALQGIGGAGWGNFSTSATNVAVGGLVGLPISFLGSAIPIALNPTVLVGATIDTAGLLTEPPERLQCAEEGI